MRRSAASSSRRLRYIPAQLFGQQTGDLSRVLQPPPRQLADRLEVEPVFQPRFPVTILLALGIALVDLTDAVALSAELDGAVDEADDAEVVQVQRVGEELGFL